MQRLVQLLVTAILYFIIVSAGAADAMQPKPSGESQSTITQSTQSPTETKSSSRGSKVKTMGQNKRHKLPKPEINRLGSGGGKKKSVAKKAKGIRNGQAKESGSQKCDLKPQTSEAESHKIKRKVAPEVKVVRTELVNDVPVLISVLSKMGVQQAIDRVVPVHKNQRDLSWGWTATIWLAYILTTGDHRKLPVREYVQSMQDTLSQLTGKSIFALDFTDDRLAKVAKYLSDDKYWPAIEKAVSKSSIEVYELHQECVRVDATTVSGYHEPIEGGQFQFGNSKDDPNRPQIKIMTGSLDPLGMPLATDVVSGEQADDGLYSPIIERIYKTLDKKGLLYVGDSKLSSMSNRLHIKGKAHGHYLCPLPNTGKVPEEMTKWIKEGNLKDQKDELTKYIVVNEKGEENLKAKGYETQRELFGKIEEEEKEKELKWTERVLIVKSPAHELQQIKGLERRLKNAEEKILALTPPRGPGKRQIVDEKILVKSYEAIIKKYKVDGLIDCAYVKEVEKKEKYKGRGRGTSSKEKITEEKVRYQITSVTRNQTKICEKMENFGWKAFVTDVSKNQLGFIEVVKNYREQYRIERIFSLLKSRLNIDPMYVKNKEQINGITHLLMLGVRVYTLIEFAVRRSLSEKGEKLVGLHPENPKKETNTPTCVRLLKAFSNIVLTVVETDGKTTRHLTPLSQLQIDILKHLGQDHHTYTSLIEIQRCQI